MEFIVGVVTCFLILTMATPCTAASKARFSPASLHWGLCLDQKHFLSVYSASLHRCVEECWTRPRCKSIAYQTRPGIYRCRLYIDDRISSGLPLSLCPGLAYMERSAWEQVPNDVCPPSHCPYEETCNRISGDCSFQECPLPPTFSGTSRLGNMNWVGNKLRYTCTEVPDRRTTMACSADGSWGDPPFCIDCGDAPLVENAVFTLDSLLSVSHKTYACNAGYAHVSTDGNAVVKSTLCQPSGAWSPTNFQCLRDCGEVDPAPDHAALSDGGTTEGTSRTYSCNQGYEPAAPNNDGSNVILITTCKSTGSWSLVNFECVISCSTPADVSNANVSPGTTMTGSVRTYNCDWGYLKVAVGGSPIADTTSCSNTGDWSATSFQCLRDCGAPPAVDNAVMPPGDTTSGTTRTYTCQPNYVPVSPTPSPVVMTTSCQTSGVWSSTNFECLRDCGPLTAEPYSSSSAAATTSGSVGTYSCQTGYEAVAPNNDGTTVVLTSTCSSTGSWSAVNFECVISCSTPADVSNANVSPGTTTTGSVRTYNCHSGYLKVAVGGAPILDTTSCSNTGDWSATSFQCLRDCRAPPGVNRAYISPGDTTSGSTRTYSCYSGYAPVSLDESSVAMTTNCQSSGDWSATNFQCLRDCGALTPLPFATATSDGTTEASTGQYTCNSGYEAVAPADGGDDDDDAVAPVNLNTVCSNFGSWSATNFQCVVSCSDPPTVTNANVAAGGTIVGSSRTYSCDTNYLMVAVGEANIDATTSCSNAGSWSSTSFECKRDCGAPTSLNNAHITSGGTTEGVSRVYSCMSGYGSVSTDGNPVTLTTTCQASGDWTSTNFQCLKDCGQLSDQPFASSSSDATTEGSDGEYTCLSGYEAIPPNNDGSTVELTTSCTSAGTWTPTNFQCVISCSNPASEEHAQVSAGGTSVGSVRTYTCDSTYLMVAATGPDTVDSTTCTNGGTWTSTDFQCKKDCGEPVAVRNATLSPGGNHDGETRTYTCSDGYDVVSTNGQSVTMATTCQTSGEWTATNFECLKSCGPLSAIDNATPVSGLNTVGTFRIYECDPGFAEVSLDDNTAVLFCLCQPTGDWSGTNFKCLEDCGEPPTVDKATLSAGLNVAGSVRTYTCHHGYRSVSPNELAAETQITCENTREWSDSNFFCQVVDTLGDTCNSDDDCEGINSWCPVNKCVCKPLYEYVAAKQQCIKKCSSYGSTWTTYSGKSIGAYNLVGLFASLADCRKYCVDYGDTCPSVNYSYGNGFCLLNQVTVQQLRDGHPEMESSAPNAAILERNCLPRLTSSGGV